MRLRSAGRLTVSQSESYEAGLKAEVETIRRGEITVQQMMSRPANSGSTRLRCVLRRTRALMRSELRSRHRGGTVGSGVLLFPCEP